MSFYLEATAEPIPEPATYGMVLAGAICLAVQRFKRKKQL
jgi:hypothetical protein